MSNRYALVRDGMTEATVLWDGITPWAPPPGFAAVAEADAPPRPVFSPPPSRPSADERLGAIAQALVALDDIPDLSDAEMVLPVDVAEQSAALAAVLAGVRTALEA